METPTLMQVKQAVADAILGRFREIAALGIKQGGTHVATLPIEVVSVSNLSVVIKVDTESLDGRGGYRYFTISVKEMM